MKPSFTRISLLLSFACIATPALSQGINLTVDNIRNRSGNIVVIVFDEESAFENLEFKNAVAFAELPASVGRLTHNFPELDTGPYAVFLFHDENADEDINFSDTRLLEGVGATGVSKLESDPNFLQSSVYPGPVNVHIFYEK